MKLAFHKLVPSPFGRGARGDGLGNPYKKGAAISRSTALTPALSQRERGRKLAFRSAAVVVCVVCHCLLASSAVCNSLRGDNDLEEVNNSNPIELDRYNVVWTTPGRSAADSMPLGNGEVGVNLWVEEGSDLCFYISRTDAYSEISRLLKVGKVRVSISPNPFAAGRPFRQELQLREGRCEITAGEDNKKLTLSIFVDIHQPVVHVVGRSDSPVSVKATVESWRTSPHVVARGEEQNSAWTMQQAPFDLVESADVFPTGLGDAAVWYHRNETSVVPLTLKHQGLESVADIVHDPLLHRTFGGWLTGEGFKAVDKRSVATPEPVKTFSLRVAVPCEQTPDAQTWLDRAKDLANRSADTEEARRRTTARWWTFWARSWVIVGNNDTINRGYILQRYVQACGGRGTLPIKFNGSIFTVEPKAMKKPFNPDWRNWGDCHWWQNVRISYHPMLASGDFEMMEPMFRMYESVRPLCEARAKIYHGAKGCYFPETMTIWGTYSNRDYGWNRTGHQPKDVLCPYWAYAWNQGPELVALMLDRWDYTQDEAFLREHVLPMAESALAYFDTRFKKDSGGKIVLDPTQSVETYWFNVVNDAPTAAGLCNITTRLCDLPERLVPAERRAFFARMKAACPAVPTEEAKRDGKVVRKLAPAEKYQDKRNNCENPELYPVWPFRLYGPGKPGLDDALAAYRLRRNHLDVGWGYDGNCAAALGLADEAARILKIKSANSNPAYRWPATWGPNFDWLPDQDHGGNLLITTQLMLLQSDGDAIRLLPAWPKDWDVRFRLHAARRTVVECAYRRGKIERLRVEPASRRKNVVCAIAKLPDLANP
jgi:hypothetical protein